jgi:hypothetical protein
MKKKGEMARLFERRNDVFFFQVPFMIGFDLHRCRFRPRNVYIRRFFFVSVAVALDAELVRGDIWGKMKRKRKKKKT